MNRYITSYILEDLEKKMVWLGGPRQVGKTTAAKAMAAAHYHKHEYFNWDKPLDRKAIVNMHWQADANLIVFDELHKYPHWKTWLKGLYDTKEAHQQFFVTGSARMDVYKRGGESLFGRYHYWRLHPFTLDEWPSQLSQQDAVDRLLTLGGFPEPLLHEDLRAARRWRNERLNNIMREDIQEIEPVRQLRLLDLFIAALKERVGSTVVFANLAGDLKVAHKTCGRWLDILKHVYIVFPIYPYTKNLPRSVQKPPKVYFYDNADVEGNIGAKFENLVATHLLKRLHFIEDYHGYRTSLHYIRDRDGREVDFLTVVDGQVYELIEVKTSDHDIGSALKYYKQKLQPRHTVQIVKNLPRPYDKGGIKVTNAETYFAEPIWGDKLWTFA